MIKTLPASTQLSAVLGELEKLPQVPKKVISSLQEVREEIEQSSSLINELLFQHYIRQVQVSNTPKATALDTFNLEFLTQDKVGHTPEMLNRLVHWLVDQFGTTQGSLWDNYLKGRIRSLPFED